MPDTSPDDTNVHPSESNRQGSERPNVPAGELRDLADDFFEAYRRRVEYYQSRLNMSAVDAYERVDEQLAKEAKRYDPLESLRESSPKEVTWSMLLSASSQDPEAAMEEWEHIKEEARGQLERGHDAAKAIHLSETPWQKARFYAVRESFIEEWEPRGGVEQRLIDTLAQTYLAWQYWLNLLHQRMLMQADKEERDRKRRGGWTPPTLEEADAEEQAAKMADRFHRMFVRTLRALRDLRRYTPNITIQNQGQVNIGGNQQVNNSASE